MADVTTYYAPGYEWAVTAGSPHWTAWHGAMEAAKEDDRRQAAAAADLWDSQPVMAR
jgi:hypothetical protein